jgi:hypothetical protein
MNMGMFARAVALLLCLAGANAADAANLSERSPLRPGLWWDATHSGSGFEIHTAPGQLFVVWYTYRADGSPVWYTAQGALSAPGKFAAPLLRHRWRDARYGGATTVGRLALSRTNAEEVQARFTVDGAGGGWTLSPYLIAGATPEIDHTGAWFDPAASGFGLTIGEQGAWLTAAYYVYDGAGEPTWAFGTNAGEGTRLTLDRFHGACPACVHSDARSPGSVALALDFRAESALAATFTDPAGVLAPEWRRSGANLTLLTTPSSRRPADRTLARFDDPQLLKSYIRDGLFAATPSASAVDFSAPPPMQSYSATNLVAAGVDEADSVKTDGRYIYTFAAGQSGYRDATLRVGVIQGNGPQTSVSSSTWLSEIPLDALAEPKLYLTEQRLVALATSAPRYYFLPRGVLPPASYQDLHTYVEVLDRTTNPLRPRSIFHATIDGTLLSSRRIGDQLYLVHRFVPVVPGFALGARDPAGLAANATAIDATPVEKLLPQIAVDDGAPAPMLDSRAVLLPPVASIRPTPELACVTRINLANPSDHETLAIAGPVSAIHVSNTQLYLATTRYEPLVNPIVGLDYAYNVATDIHQIALDSGHPQFVASGMVDGYVDRDLERAPFRLAERDGRLSVVTVGLWEAGGMNRLSVLERSSVAPDVLRTVATLPNRARPEPIGKRDEFLYGTRFVEDKLYAVTFHKIDPLYVIALDPPTDPHITGEVQLPGFSEYLHPLSNGLLLGFGKDSIPGATVPGQAAFDWYQGLKLTLFDVSNEAAPRVLDSRVIGRRGSDSALLRDHHAFAGLPIAGGAYRFAIPMRVHEADGTEPSTLEPWYYYPYQQSGLYAFEVDPTRGAAAHLTPFPPLITQRHSSAGDPYDDDATTQARSVLLPTGAIYVERGRFWFAPWSDLAHPAGPY